MESLGELLRGSQGRQLLKQAEEKLREVAADPLIVKLRSKYPQLDNQTIKLNLNKLHQYVKEYNNCTNCPGLDRCPNDLEGHYTMLQVEPGDDWTRVYDHKVACKKFLAKSMQDAVRSRIRSFYVDERALSQGYSSLEILDKDPQREEAVGQVMDYILNVRTKGLPQTGLYLAGHFGTGKTFLMCYMLYELAKDGYTGAIVYMPDFAEDLKSMFQDPLKLKETIDILKETDLLVFDDIGAENLNPWLRDHVMGAILNYRMNRKPTFFTSNHDLDALEKHFSFTSKDGDEEYKGRRIMDRIRPFVDVVMVNGYNKRGSK
ncbi:ATP-binding protein [Paenibacillus validus]|uniref:AFG1/ZapE family ATPase n=1 Tax=Paenibacillus validus TaxID=44253 RepID=UPI000FDCC4F7|nr:AFG1/ZapE family ATPase [Paenibacillus validus]MED4603602.1 ATP-binding protein [Paenibacillus validus]MED4609265.1 ATP-binding protein [Paenibacillus validus]